MTRADGPSFAEAIGGQPEALALYMKAMVRLQLAIHRHEAVLLPDLKARLIDRIRRAAALGGSRQGRLLDRLADMPNGDRLCHGDFHPFNVMGEPDNACIVDWLDATRGEPAADACRSYLLMRGVEPTWASARSRWHCRCRSRAGSRPPPCRPARRCAAGSSPRQRCGPWSWSFPAARRRCGRSRWTCRRVDRSPAPG
ncbi:MAG: phosphotransferase [Reyranella sp.]|nr:phosphotransferase [Reyranella sp.]